MWGLIDVISVSKTPVYTYCFGYALSAGFIIFLAGHKRYASKHAVMMYHQFWAEERGKYQDIKENQKHYDKSIDQLESYVLKRTNIQKKIIKKVREKKQDLYIYSDKFKEYGLIDDFIDGSVWQ